MAWRSSLAVSRSRPNVIAGLAAAVNGRRPLDRFLPPRSAVHCRIQVRREHDGVVVHLAGRLAGKGVPELLEACIAAKPLILELDELVSADAVGLDALLRIEEGGGLLVGTPEYIRLKLNVLASERRR
jgi:hypothetical protein